MGDFLQDLLTLWPFDSELLWHDDEAIVNRPHFPFELDLMKFQDDNLHQTLVMVKYHLTVAEKLLVFNFFGGAIIPP